MAFGKKNDKNIEENSSFEASGDNATATPVKLPVTENKATRLAALIRQGGQTKETLMAAMEVNPAGLASQLSYLNTRGLNIAEVDTAKAEFPMKDDNGVYRMGTLDEYLAEAKKK